MAEKLKITILTDKSSWMNKYNKILLNKFSDMGHNVNLINSKREIEHGDILFLLSCFELVPKKYLKFNKNNIVVHESDLPSGKGWSPLTWQVLEGKKEIPITLFEANDKCDDGKIYIKDFILLDGHELVDGLREKQGLKTIEICCKYIENFGNIKSIKQEGKESFYKKRTPVDSELDINKTILEQFNLFRVVDNECYPAFFMIDNKKYTLNIKEE